MGFGLETTWITNLDVDCYLWICTWKYRDYKLDYNYQILMDLDLEILGLWFRIIKMGQLWTKRDLVARKTYLKFLRPNSNNLWHAQIKQIFLSIPRHFGRNELSIKASSLSIKDMFINMWQFLAILWTFELLHFDQLFSSNLQSGG